MEEWLHHLVESLPMGPLALALLAFAAGIEYIFPPFPGDTIVLIGAFLVGAREWNLPLVFAAVNLGGLAGIYLDYRFGRFVAIRERGWREDHPLWRRAGRSLDRILPLFARRPALYLVINRFLPSIRGLFFVAAGMAQVPLTKVLLCGAISALCWNALIFAIGASVGRHWETLMDLFARYNAVIWSLLGALLLLALARAALRRRRRTDQIEG